MDRLRGPGATLERHESDMSSFTNGDLSCFTMDSVNLRKTQLVADPILDDDDGMTYTETDSYADHESVSRASQFSEYPIEASQQRQLQRYPSRGVKKSFSCDSMGPMRFDKLQITSAAAAAKAAAHDDHDSDEDSFGTMTSGLTTDFTEHEFLEDSESEEDNANDPEQEDDDNEGNVLLEEDDE